MKKIYSTLFACLLFIGANATSYTVSISGFAYAPNSLTVSIGDVITIQASGSHPLVEVDNTTWTANGTTSLSTGWGVKSADYTFTVTSANPIYFVCQIHGGMGMKGQISVAGTGINELTSELNSLTLFPIPAKNNIQLNYQLAKQSLVNIELLNVAGQKIATLLSEQQNAGAQQNLLVFPLEIASGTYFIKVDANGNSLTKRLIIIQ